MSDCKAVVSCILVADTFFRLGWHIELMLFLFERFEGFHLRVPLVMCFQAGELPLEELLALCGYTVSDSEKQTCHVTASLPAVTLQKVRYQLRHAKSNIRGTHEDAVSNRSCLLVSHHNNQMLTCAEWKQHGGLNNNRRLFCAPLCLLRIG